MFLIPRPLGGAMCLPVELEQRSLQNLRSRSLVHSPSLSDALIYVVQWTWKPCVNYSTAKMEGVQVPESLLGWDIGGTLTFLTLSKNHYTFFWICLWSRRYNCNYYIRQPRNFLFCSLILVSGQSAGIMFSFWSTVLIISALLKDLP